MPHGGSVEIRLRKEDGKAHYHGLVRCACWHSCPVCGWQIAMHRAEEIRQVADAHRAVGGAVYLVTFTLPHDIGDRLEPLYHAVTDSYRFVHSGAAWLKIKEHIGYVGEIRALEATVGANGWHPHLHVLLFTLRPLDAERLGELRSYFLRRWSRRIEECGFRAPSEEHGVTIALSHVDEYLAKMGLADELAKGEGKEAEGKSRTPLQVLADFAVTGDAADLALWREWGMAMHAARQLTWSRGLRGRYAIAPPMSDAEVVAGQSEGAEEVVALVSAETWFALSRVDLDVAWRLLDAAESGGAEAVDVLVRVTVVRSPGSAVGSRRH